MHVAELETCTYYTEYDFYLGFHVLQPTILLDTKKERCVVFFIRLIDDGDEYRPPWENHGGLSGYCLLNRTDRRTILPQAKTTVLNNMLDYTIQDILCSRI